MSKNEFLIEKYDKLRVDIKMYMSEISKFKISDLKAQKMIILWTMKHVSAIRKHPVFRISIVVSYIPGTINLPIRVRIMFKFLCSFNTFSVKTLYLLHCMKRLRFF